MPPNMKMPIIKVTPSSPSPDPNHPDYPEFFEDKLYLDHVTRPQDSLGNIENQVSLDSFTLVLDPDEESDENCDNTVEEDVNMCDTNITLCDQRSVLKLKRNKSFNSDHKCNNDISINYN